MKKMFLITILVLTIIGIGIRYKNQLGMDTFYPQTGIVKNVDYENDIVTFEVFNGNLWEFKGCYDWYEGDIVSAIMFNNLTKSSVYDDKIISVKYSGYVY